MIVDPVTEDEVFKRLRTVLEPEGLRLRRGTLDGAKDDDLGRFYTTDVGGAVNGRHVELERWARQRGVLHANEAMVPSHGAVDP